MTREWLDVPFSEKDRAKACGARWDPAAKRWYAPRPGMAGLERWAARPDLPTLLPGEDRSFGSGLYIEPIPKTVWWTHARSCIAAQDWDRVRLMVARRAGRRCEACGRCEDRAAGIRMETHERWLFDAATQTQRLRRLVCFCTDCHSVTHFGLAQIRGVDAQALAHLCTVTGMSEAEADRHLESAIALWQQRSAMLWDLDLRILTAVGVGIVKPTGSAADRGRRALAGPGAGHDRSQANVRTGPPGERPPPVTIANRPRNPELGSRWERWLKTGER